MCNSIENTWAAGPGTSTINTGTDINKETYPASPLEPLPCKCLFYCSPDEISVLGDFCLKFLQGGFCLPSRVGFFFFFLSLWTEGIFLGHPNTDFILPHLIPLATNPFQNHFCSEIYSLKLHPTSSIFISPLPLQANFGRPQQIPDDRAKWNFDSAPLIVSLQSQTIPTRGGFFSFSPRILIENHNEKPSLGLPPICW